jgi:hypothetical protein
MLDTEYIGMTNEIVCEKCNSDIKLCLTGEEKLKLSCECSGFYSEHLDALQHASIFPNQWKSRL